MAVFFLNRSVFKQYQMVFVLVVTRCSTNCEVMSSIEENEEEMVLLIKQGSSGE